MKFAIAFLQKHSITISIVMYFLACVYSKYSISDITSAHVNASTLALNVTLIITAIYGMTTWRRELWQKEMINAVDEFYGYIHDAIVAIEEVSMEQPNATFDIKDKNYDYEYDVFILKLKKHMSNKKIFALLDRKAVYFESSIGHEACQCACDMLSIYSEYNSKLLAYHFMHRERRRINHEYTDEFMSQLLVLELYICNSSNSELYSKIEKIRNTARDIQRKHHPKNPLIL